MPMMRRLAALIEASRQMALEQARRPGAERRERIAERDEPPRRP